MGRILKGTITSNRMMNTVIVRVEATKIHPLYKKRFKFTTRFAADNPNNQYKTGDLVEIEESRPLSKTKHWVVKRAISAQEAQEA